MFPLDIVDGVWYITARYCYGGFMRHMELKSVEEIGKLVRDKRRRQKVTQLQLAGLAGTGIRLVSDLENGKGTIQIQKLLAVVQTLGLGMFIFSPWENE